MVAIYDTLINNLKSNNPVIRIQSLHVLAMVEETRALDVILDMFKNDPDSTVRKTAQWAGNLIWEAKQQGADALVLAGDEQSATSDSQDESLEYKEKRILDSLMVVPTSREMKMQNQQELLRAEWDRLNTVSQKRATSTTSDQVIADIDMLEAGLSDAFRAYLEEQE